MLAEDDYQSWPKVTGGKGLHLMVLVASPMTHDAARLYCKRIAQRIERGAPDRYRPQARPKYRPSTSTIFRDGFRPHSKEARILWIDNDPHPMGIRVSEHFQPREVIEEAPGLPVHQRLADEEYVRIAADE